MGNFISVLLIFLCQRKTVTLVLFSHFIPNACHFIGVSLVFLGHFLRVALVFLSHFLGVTLVFLLHLLDVLLTLS